jgi:hypothetical protein
VAGVLVALHFDEVGQFVERWVRQLIGLGVAIGVAATMWYLIAVGTGSGTGRASDLYQSIAFLWFTAAVAALEGGTWWWFRRTMTNGQRPGYLSAAYLASRTGGILFCHVLFLNLVRSGLGATGLVPHLGWAGTVVVTYVLTLSISASFTALVLLTPLRWVLTGPVRKEQRARLSRRVAEGRPISTPEISMSPA